MDRRRLVAITAVALVVAFAIHLAYYGSWIVDDAGISLAYAQNLAHGHGLVAQPGAARVEGFSNPLWVALLAGLFEGGVLGHRSFLGLVDYAMVFKGLAVVFHGVVLACLYVVIRRVITAVSGRTPSCAVVCSCWAATGLLLAANPSYVIWMGSGLENPLFAALVTAIAAVTVTALPTPSRPQMVALGALSGMAALTRPDGVVYAGATLAVALLAAEHHWRARVALAAWGASAFALVFLPYVLFRRVYFDAWLPNTATAKDQALPTLSDVADLRSIARYYGWLLIGFALAGTCVAVVRCARARNGDAIRVIAGGASILGAALIAYVVLLTDWMGEYRFLTPAWPLASVAAALGALALAVVPRSRTRRVAAVLVLALLGAMILPTWANRARVFHAAPTLSLCFVADRFGRHFDRAAMELGLDPRRSSIILADIGAVLLVSDLRVFDLAGLADPTIARLLRDGDHEGIAALTLEELRPTFVHVHHDWVARSGLLVDARFREDYVDVFAGEEWIRRDVVATATPEAIDRIAADAARPRPQAGQACASLLFS